MPRISLLLLALLAAPAPLLAATAVDIELVLAADGSGSIDTGEMRLQRDGYADAITHPRVLEAIRAGRLGRIALAYVEWGSAVSRHTIVDWAVIDGDASAAAFADRLRTAPRRASGYNSISAAIDYSARMIRDNDYAGDRLMIDVSGDGPNIGGRSIWQARDEAVAAGITVNGLVIAGPQGNFRGPGGMPLIDYFREAVIGGIGAFALEADRRLNFARAVRIKLLREIARANGLPEGEPG
ncbi:MAG: DUF1194 domain-containing protein [Acetobacterales bacterium]